MVWAPGQSGNPAGRPRISEELRGIKTLKLDDVRAMCGKYARMTIEQLSAACDDPDTPVMELVVARSLQKAVVEGDMKQLNYVLDRAVGKVKELPEGKDVSSMALPEILALARVAMQFLEQQSAISVHAEDVSAAIADHYQGP